MKTIPSAQMVLCALILTLILTIAELKPVFAQSIQQGASSVSVKKERDPDARSPLSPEGKYITPNVNDIKGTIVPRAGRPAPKLPLYRQYSPDQVIVGEVGSHFVLTRLELERLALAKVMVNARMQGVDPNPKDDIAEREWERLQQETEDEVLREWAFIKTVVMEARKAGLTVAPEEIEAKLAELAREGIGANANEQIQKYNKAIGVEQDKLREQISDALLMDKYIMKRVQQRFSENELKAIYEKSPTRYATPMQIHLWQIYRKIDPQTVRKGSKEYSDMREDFYDIAKKAGKNDGKNFEELARQHSDDPMTKEAGGDMGWIDASVPLPEEITKAINKMKVGEVSKMVETPTGFHVFRITEIQQPKGLTYDESARQKVIDECVFQFKEQMVDTVLRAASEKVRINASGLRLRNGTYAPPVTRATAGAAQAIAGQTAVNTVVPGANLPNPGVIAPAQPSAVQGAQGAATAVNNAPALQLGVPSGAPPQSLQPAAQVISQPVPAAQPAAPSIVAPPSGALVVAPTGAPAAAVAPTPVAPVSVSPSVQLPAAVIAVPTPTVVAPTPAVPIPATAATPLSVPGATPASGPVLITPSGIKSLPAGTVPDTSPVLNPTGSPIAPTPAPASAPIGVSTSPATAVQGTSLAPAGTATGSPIAPPVVAAPAQTPATVIQGQ